MATCRSCGQVIDWVKLVSGKSIPVNEEYVNYEDAETGDILVTDGGNVIRVSDKSNYPNIKGRISHFATCPDADKWRKG